MDPKVDRSLPWFVGTVQDFESCGIPTGDLRKSIDGTKAIVHQQNLTAEQYTAIRPVLSIIFMYYEEALQLLATAEWVTTDDSMS